MMMKLMRHYNLKNILSKTIDEMELSVRSHNCLQAAGIYKISELVSKEESQMLKYKNFGRKSLTELVEKLGSAWIKFWNGYFRANGIRIKRFDL